MPAFGSLLLGLTLACGVETAHPAEDALDVQEARVKFAEPDPGRDIFQGRCPMTANGPTLYVSNTGPWSPSSPLGSSANPYRTIAAAVAAAVPGNIIEVRGGTYPERVVISPDTARPGTSMAPIVLRGQASARPRIVPPTDRAVGSVLNVSQPYWILQFLEVDAQSKASFGALFERNTYCSQLVRSALHRGTAGGGVVLSYANNVLISQNEIYDFSKSGADSHGVVIKDSAREVFVLENQIHETSGDSVQCQTNTGRPSYVYIENNVMHDAGENGVDIKGCDSIFIRNNTMFNFPNLTLYPWAVNSSAAEAVVLHVDPTNIQIVSNTISQAGRGVSVGSISPGTGPVDVLIRANTISDIYNFQNRGNGQGIRIVQGNRIQVLQNRVQRTVDAGLRLAADAPHVVTGLSVFDNILQDMQLFVRLGDSDDRRLMQMDRNTYQGPTGKFTATNLVWNVDFPAWRAALASEGLEQNSVRIP
ncbi:right-handed parallel beta-helix repeat-containing protein [Corallococcus sp. EGB]|uniref:right-handed parallel beta-helix repeat-containing protein n=1 Tax=Corallococcus sp. EGB TaxID=1521117 RepID=UPI001CC04E69|nr:right-handed parallel beta-helix repeat-containing protein [Corallococcus sp. EGB]